jgi:hypothetical protein
MMVIIRNSDDSDDNNSIQFFIIYVPSQQLQGQLQSRHSVDTSNYIMDRHNIKSKTDYRQALEENTLMQRSHWNTRQYQIVDLSGHSV